MQLLIVGCSATKRPDPGLLPALARYNGPTFWVLRKAMREGRLPGSLHILIVSARYGLLPAHHPIEDYNQRMTTARARELRVPVSLALDDYLRVWWPAWSRVLVAVGRAYQGPVWASQGLQILDTQGRVTRTHGGIGCQLAQLRAWLLGPQETAVDQEAGHGSL